MRAAEGAPGEAVLRNFGDCELAHYRHTDSLSGGTLCPFAGLPVCRFAGLPVRPSACLPLEPDAAVVPGKSGDGAISRSWGRFDEWHEHCKGGRGC